jgi:hypothetical protein|tara:strand:- start:1278 stop:1625 length:348 start_codon:yes stop_codon:yes gene_type:complete
MPHSIALDNNKKLEIIYRIEGGCLGPEGHNHIDKFCTYAQEKIQSSSSNFVNLNIVPRHDKSLAEMQFSVLSKKITHLQAEKYLSYFGQSLDDIECELSDQLTGLIETYANEHIQ